GKDIVKTTISEFAMTMGFSGFNEDAETAKQKIVILDEADEMLDMGFIDDIEEIISHTPKQRQTLLFSATISDEVKNIARRYEINSKFLKIKDNKANKPKIKQYYYETPRNKKLQVLYNILGLYEVNLALVFCNTKSQLIFYIKNLKIKDIMLHPFMEI
ncbi:DEAD/DEAH box helicase, partial [Methanobrevibacter sp.]